MEIKWIIFGVSVLSFIPSLLLFDIGWMTVTEILSNKPEIKIKLWLVSFIIFLISLLIQSAL